MTTIFLVDLIYPCFGSEIHIELFRNLFGPDNLLQSLMIIIEVQRLIKPPRALEHVSKCFCWSVFGLHMMLCVFKIKCKWQKIPDKYKDTKTNKYKGIKRLHMLRKSIKGKICGKVNQSMNLCKQTSNCCLRQGSLPKILCRFDQFQT